jgi:hypothetical protein
MVVATGDRIERLKLNYPPAAMRPDMYILLSTNLGGMIPSMTCGRPPWAVRNLNERRP